MKRIAIISLLAVFLITNYAYATFPLEELAQTIEKGQHEELTQEEVDELFIAMIASVDWENPEVQPDSCISDLTNALVYYFVLSYIVNPYIAGVLSVLRYLRVLLASCF